MVPSRYNNPVTEVEAEAQLLWCPDQVELKSLFKCFLSIGTGKPAPGVIEDNALELAFGSIIKIVTDTEETHRRFNDRWLSPTKKHVFRFDVPAGL